LPVVLLTRRDTGHMRTLSSAWIIEIPTHL
jgi:hypothetical protein